jgi:RNA polymerase sigma-70 factor (ECF subfamily)
MSSLTSAHFEADSAALQSPAPPAKLPPNRAALSDADLFCRARHGDGAAYAHLASRHQNSVFNVLLRLSGDHEQAASFTQETFNRGLAKIDESELSVAPSIWFLRIALAIGLAALRQGRRRRPAQAAPAPAASPFGPQSAEREDQRALLESLSRVDADYRAVLVMRDVAGFEHEQIADILGAPVASIKSRLFRARLALRDELQGKR